MCGILFYKSHPKFKHEETYTHTRQKHRGPDDTQMYDDGTFVFGFHRLSINGISNGNQPCASTDAP